MSFYQMLFGQNVIAPVLLKMLDIDQADGKWSSGRFRDIYLDADGERILMYTRNGGGNRECWSRNGWEGYKDDSGKCHCPGCVISELLPQHPNYVEDYDDEFDSTYATIVFSVPDEFKELAKALATGVDPASIGEKFRDAIAALSSDKAVTA